VEAPSFVTNYDRKFWQGTVHFQDCEEIPLGQRERKGLQKEEERKIFIGAEIWHWVEDTFPSKLRGLSPL